MVALELDSPIDAILSGSVFSQGDFVSVDPRRDPDPYHTFPWIGVPRGK